MTAPLMAPPGVAPPQAPPARGNAPEAPAAWLVLLAVLATVAVGLCIVCVRHAVLAYDEYQHMHAAYLVARGQTPFVDFFEHHTPLLYYVLAALIPMRAPSFDTMIDARYLSLSVHLLTVLLGARWARACADRATGFVAAALLLGNVCLFTWGTRTYLDTYAAPLLLGSAWLLPVQRKHPLRYFFSAALLGIAVLITQKAAMAAFAPAAVLLLTGVRGLSLPAQRRSLARDLAAYVAGGLSPVLLLVPLLGVAGMAGMVRDAVLLNMAWKARHFPWRELEVLLASDGVIYAVAAAGAARRIWSLWRRRGALTPADLPDLFLLSLCIGVFYLPVVWEEYFILLLPFAVIVAARTLVEWWRSAISRSDSEDAARRRGRAAVIALFAVLSAADLVAVRYLSNNPLSAVAAALVPALWLTAAAAIYQARRHGWWWEPAAWLALLLVLPLVEQADWTPRHPNTPERQRVSYVMAHTGPTDPVFDGRSGWGVFRPHAYRYWFLHDEMQLMMTDEERGPAIIAALEQQQVPIVIVDDFTRLLPRSVLDYIKAHYVDTPFPDIKRRAPASSILNRH